MNTIYIYLFYFIIYSFLGWICETIYCSIIDREYVNRGFLKGPFCPIYGAGALIVTILLTPFSKNIIVLYLSAMIFTSVLEYITGFLLETMFDFKWWDYKDNKFNIKGRVCLLNSTLFGILSIIAVKIINPIIAELVRESPLNIIIWTCDILIMYFLMDIIITTYKVLQLGGKLEEMSILLEEIKEKSENYKSILQQNLSRFDGLIEQESEKIIYAKGQISKLKIKLENVILKNRSVNKRIIRAFPNIKSLKHQYSLDRLKEEIKKIKRK
ncbi:putative ABC transporter permease [Clostridium sp.]|uniref:putative ABC transporter permease n=1 Tax=Clostridium sp. TaxID=1506 RepID=UPI002610C8C8|nr:putative ABC transporter permease [Clostridium sp.]